MASTNDLKTGINQVLVAEFPNINVYGEDVMQGFEKPCFFIKILNSTLEKQLNRRYKKSISFDINYFTNKENINADCNDTADKLYEVLEYVQASNSLYRATNKKHEVKDGILHFYLTFNFMIIKQMEEATKMQKLVGEAGLKNE